MTSAEFYDSDDALNDTERLVAVKPNYNPEESPPPFITESTSSHSSPPDTAASEKGGSLGKPGDLRRTGKKRGKRKGRTRPSPGDAVLISYLDPNRPDIAQEVGQTALNSASQSEAEDGESGEEDGEVEDMFIVGDPKKVAKNLTLATTASQALEAVVNDVDMKDAAADVPRDAVSRLDISATNGIGHGRDTGYAAKETFIDLEKSVSSPLNLKPPPRTYRSLPPTPIHIGSANPSEEKDDDEHSLATSPNLAKFTITPAEANPESTLPAMQKSPPRSASAHPPDSSQNLPSLKTTLSQISDCAMKHGVNGVGQFSQSPTSARQQLHPHALSPSAYSHPSPAMSPPGLPSHPNYWRTAPKEGSYSTPSSSIDAPTPTSIPGQSPANSYPTPGIQDHRSCMDGSSTPQLISGPLSANGPFSSSAFQCTHPGCNAPPFQTQYLLNSHANVHSSNRPHFCPVKDCPRGPGGKGFKRKNGN